MKIYIEADGNFYHWPSWGANFSENVLDYVLSAETKTDKRDFEIGSRVYFQGVGWTEVKASYGDCQDCCFDAGPECHGYGCVNPDRFFVPLKTDAPAPSDETKHDAVHSPKHYTDRVPGIECKEVVAHFPYFPGAAIKYIWRAGLKDDIVQDYEKAIECLRIEIDKIKKARND